MLNRLWMQHIREFTQFKCHKVETFLNCVSTKIYDHYSSHVSQFLTNLPTCEHTSIIIHIPQFNLSSPLAQTGPLTHDYILRMYSARHGWVIY